MSKQFQRGGQRRTIEAGCGWRCVGHPQEVNGKYRIHKKICNTCKESNTSELPEFNKAAGLMNGWKGLTNRNQLPNQMLTTALIDGEQYDIFSGASKLADAMDEAYLTANLIADNFIQVQPKELSKSQKKRLKKKAKEVKANAINLEPTELDVDIEEVLAYLEEREENEKRGK